MNFGARSTGTRQTIWRTTFNLSYLIEYRNRAVLFDWVEFISVFFFQQLLVESISSLEWQIVSISGEISSKLRVSKTILTNPCKIIQFPQCENIYVSHLKKRTPSIIVVTASQFVKLSKLIGMCNLNFTVGKIGISKVFFSVWCLMQTYQSLVSENWWLLW